MSDPELRAAFDAIYERTLEAMRGTLRRSEVGELHVIDSFMRNPAVANWMRPTGFREFEVRAQNGERQRFRMRRRYALPFGHTMFVCEASEQQPAPPPEQPNPVPIPKPKRKG